MVKPGELSEHEKQMQRIATVLAEGDELERQAVALMRQYGFFLPSPAKEFFRKLAVYLCWKNLERVL